MSDDKNARDHIEYVSYGVNRNGCPVVMHHVRIREDDGRVHHVQAMERGPESTRELALAFLKAASLVEELAGPDRTIEHADAIPVDTANNDELGIAR